MTGPIEGAKYVYEDASAEIREKVSQIEQICRRHNVPLAAAAIQFPMAHPVITSVIPGSLHPRQVEENLAHFQAEIPAALWSDLKAEGFNVAFLLGPSSPAISRPADSQGQSYL